MRRYGQVARLKPESRDEYLKHHRAVWPGVLRTIAECNIRNYSIFEHGELLFAYFEYHGTDFAADMSKMAACPETQRWWALMFPMLEKLPPEIHGQRWTDLQRSQGRAESGDGSPADDRRQRSRRTERIAQEARARADQHDEETDCVAAHMPRERASMRKLV